jgi:hypothetical protein
LGISAIGISPIMFLLYTSLIRSTTLRKEEMIVAFFPGLASGTLWASGILKLIIVICVIQA